MIRAILHKIAHLLGWNYGRVVSGIEGGYIMIGFQCDGCGEIQDWHKSSSLKRCEAAVGK